MPKKKQKTTMLVRGVPLDVWERIRGFCRKEGIKYGEFVERAIDLLEGPNGEQVQDTEREKKTEEGVNPSERVAQIAETVKDYKNAIKLRKDLIAISENIGFLADWEHQAHIYLWVVRTIKELDDNTKKSIPKYDIPDDPKERAAMGLPEEYCDKPFFTGQLEEAKRRSEEAVQAWKGSSGPDEIPSSKELKEKIEKLKREFREEDLAGRVKPNEDSAKTLRRQDRVQFGVAATAEPFQGPAEDEPEPELKKEQIKTTESGPEVGDGKKGSEGD